MRRREVAGRVGGREGGREEWSEGGMLSDQSFVIRIIGGSREIL